MKNNQINILVGHPCEKCGLALEEGALLVEIMQASRIKLDDESYSTAKKGVEVFLSEIINSACHELRVKK